MFGLSNKEKYAHYLAWFEKEVSDPANWPTMRADKDCCNYQTEQMVKPEPYSFNEAAIRFMDPKVWAKALDKKHAEQRAFVKEQLQYVGGNKSSGQLINPEYVKNEEARIATNKELAKSYSVYTELSNKQIAEVNEKHREALEPQENWAQMSAFQAFKHWISGGKVESVANDTQTWRQNEPKRK